MKQDFHSIFNFDQQSIIRQRTDYTNEDYFRHVIIVRNEAIKNHWNFTERIVKKNSSQIKH